MLLLLLGCPAPAEVIDGCAATPDACLTFASGDDCRFMGNACTDVVYCAHVDQEIAVVEIGCSVALEHPWPEPETCTCQTGVCASGQ